ncbi:MAG TPA: proton-conducting transporter membrane subunit, partial [Gemmataceae bacterium]|nr:proton-conducting transporter membrane subunit [Gemmataceae bacterium]
PASNAALLALVPKAAGFVALLRVLAFVPPEVLGPADNAVRHPGLILGADGLTLLWILAAATMTLGNVLALLQNNLRRLLAYSSVAHAGYMLIGLAVAAAPGGGRASGGVGGVEAVLFYLVAYGAMTVGAFGVLVYLSTPQRPVETVDDLAGLSRSHPGVALLMVLFLFSLIGIPFTAGFAGKVLLFWGAMGVPGQGEPTSELQARLFRILALIGVINAAAAAWYYLRIVGVMYLRGALRPLENRRALPGLVALGACALVTLTFGVYPWPLLRAAEYAVPRPPAVVGLAPGPAVGQR